MANLITATIYNSIVDNLQKAFVKEANEEVNAAVDILQKVGQIFVDENPDNSGQLSELLINIGQAVRGIDGWGQVAEKPIIPSALYNMMVDALQAQFVDSSNDNLNAGIDVLQKLVEIALDEYPDNREQYLKVLVVIGKAAKESNLLD